MGETRETIRRIPDLEESENLHAVALWRNRRIPDLVTRLIYVCHNQGFCIAFIMALFSLFDVSVLWPIYHCYWIILCAVTMKRQILHMIKYKYIPFNLAKQGILFT